MSISSQVVECSCGRSALELSGQPLYELYCHCADCQKVHGAALVPVALYRTPSVTVARGELTSFRLRTTPRHSCPLCGTRMFSEPTPHVRAVMATLLPPGSFEPRLHIYCASARVRIADGLPHYADLPSKMGGSDARVDW